MKFYALIALLFVAAHKANACFSANPGSIHAVTTSSDYVKYNKQWTLKQNTEADVIDALDLTLAGAVFVSHVDTLPTGVLGYVNLTGDSQTFVDAWCATKRGNHNHGVLNITIPIHQEGYLLTEIYLASKGIVSSVEIERSAQVVIEKMFSLPTRTPTSP
ncbi:LOW QUALITY PROTEIN: hypothetical protein PHMEG_00036718 [Phytophthora megakarya]|uniref:Uncharacterized protein n=1 Tax=Phytophthora megakarya TaxID=4795 RepID=A0A225UKW9_9STRA|nr:LOW QUALITY PROTEIN: hypothetical protein PHMEG_00036718 [Phytophthora megakarya]